MDEIPFPGVMFANPNIANAIVTFYYMRCRSVSVTIKINSTHFHQGAMLVASIPNRGATEPNLTTVGLSGLNCVTLSYATQDACEINLPWLSPYLFFGINPPVATDTTVGSLQLRPLVALAAAGSVPAEITYQVYAHFNDPQVAGFVVQQATETSRFNKMPSSVTDEESESVPSETIAKTAGSIVSRGITDFVKPAIREITAPFKGVIDFLDSGGGLFDKPVDYKQAMPMQPRWSRGDSYGEGSCIADRLSLYPISKLGTVPLMDCESSYMSLSHFAQYPMLHHNYSFHNSNLITVIGVNPMYRGAYNLGGFGRPDYLATAASISKRWRGSIKYHMQLYTNQFVKARMRISLVIDPASATAITGGDFPNIILDIKGDTMLDFSIPYLWDTLWRDVIEPDPNYSVPELRFQLFADPTGMDEDNFINMVLWRSGGTDIQFSFLSLPEFKEVPTVRQEVAIRNRFNKHFEAITCEGLFFSEHGYCNTEVLGGIGDILKRYQPRAFENPQFGPWYESGVPPWVAPYDTLIRCFRYYRGGTRRKVIFVTDPEDEPDPSTYPQYFAVSCGNIKYDYALGATANTPHAGNPVLEWESPYYSKFHFMPIRNTESYLPVTSADGPSTYCELFNTGQSKFESLQAAADDFQMFFLWPPEYVIPPENKKKALQTLEPTNKRKSTIKRKSADIDLRQVINSLDSNFVCKSQ